MDRIIGLNIKKMFLDTNKKRAFQKYEQIVKNFKNTNVATDKIFQKKFNGFYRVRRNVEWQKVYYAIMERGKTQTLSFERVLYELYNATGRVEASFASKLIHTLNNDMPIWDKFVLQNLGLKMPVCKGEKKIQKSIFLYQKIVNWYEQVLTTIEINQKITEFDGIFPEYKWFSETKKIDFLLWQIRD